MNLRLNLLFLLLLLLDLSLHHADSGSIVKFLPGFEGPLPFQLETGYIGIGEEEEKQLFYYFIKSERKPEEDPLLIWLTGGPGCSALVGLLFENGPVALKFEVYNGTVPSLISTTYSWTKMVNIIFLDQPIGAGFSYSRTPIGKTSDTNEVKMIHQFLQKWLSKHPQYLSNPFYVVGDSYSGMTVPALVQEISKGNYICCKPLINLQGYVLGNPITHAEIEKNHRIPFSHGMSLISDELYESLKRNCKGNYENVDPSNTKCLKLVEEYHKCTDKINQENILLPDCDDKRNSQHTSPDCSYYVYYLIECWANNEKVREALLHVHKGSKGHWARCNWTIPYDHDIISSVPYHLSNSISGYRSLVYRPGPEPKQHKQLLATLLLLTIKSELDTELLKRERGSQRWKRFCHMSNLSIDRMVGKTWLLRILKKTKNPKEKGETKIVWSWQRTGIGILVSWFLSGVIEFSRYAYILEVYGDKVTTDQILLTRIRWFMWHCWKTKQLKIVIMLAYNYLQLEDKLKFKGRSKTIENWTEVERQRVVMLTPSQIHYLWANIILKHDLEEVYVSMLDMKEFVSEKQSLGDITQQLENSEV